MTNNANPPGSQRSWTKKVQRRAKRTSLKKTSEVAIAPNVVLEADADHVVLSMVDRTAGRGFRSKWDREEVLRILSALACWLECGALK